MNTNHTIDAAKDRMNAAKEAANGTVHDVKSSMWDALKNVGEIVAFVRRLGLDDALGVVGLTRRTSGFASAGVFASGIVVGAGLGMLLAPMSGADARAFLLGRIKTAMPDGDAIKETVHQAEKKTQDFAHDAVKAVADAVKHENGAARHAAENIEHRVDAALNKMG
jgi:gas vesicle protein